MQKTTLLDFVTKLSELANPKKQEQTDTAKNPKTDEQPAKPQENTSTFKNAESEQTQESPSSFKNVENEQTLMKSYNPFETSAKARTQLNMPRAQKPTKDKIDLSLCKNLSPKEGSEGRKNMIELINRHNAFSNKIKGN